MILLIDNYDSFSYNLVQYIGSIETDIQIIRNDAKTIEEIERMKPQAIILSPGPGYPKDAGVCIEAVKKLGERIPILGVCLGHQAICEAYGAKITHAKKLMHGKQSMIRLKEDDILFQGIPSPAPVARYHSLAADTDGGWRSDGSTSQRISGIRSTVSSRVHIDQRWYENDRELYRICKRKRGITYDSGSNQEIN